MVVNKRRGLFLPYFSFAFRRWICYKTEICGRM